MTPQQTIESHYSTLTPELQRAADLTLHNVNDLVALSMRAYASRIGVKPATLLRLAQRLGYVGWGELKEAFVQGLGLSLESHQARAEKLVDKGSTASLYQEVFDAHAANLSHTEAENQQAMTVAVEVLDAADHVYVCGFRASYSVAYTLFYIYRLFNKNVSLIDGQASNYEIFTRELTPKDVVLMIGFAPYSRESLDVLGAARRAGSKIVALTDSPLSPLAQDAASTLYFSAHSPSFFPSVVSAMGIAECLLAMMVAKHGDRAVEKIASAERFLLDSGAWVKPVR